MPQPLAGPATLAAVKLQASLTDDREDVYLTDLTIPAVNDLIRGLPIAQVDAVEWDGRIQLAAAMLGARLLRRRNSPTGVEAMTDQGAAYVSRNDPDLAQLLKIGSYAKPQAR